MDNNSDYNASDYFRDMIADIEGSYEEYNYWKEVLLKDNYEQVFMKKSRAKCLTDYLMNFDDVVEWLDYLNEIAHEIEDYEFCAVLLNRRLWAHWKLTAIDEQLGEMDDQSFELWIDDINKQ